MSKPSVADNTTAQVQTDIPPVIPTVTYGVIEDNENWTGPDSSSGEVFADLMMMNRYEQDGHRYMLGVTSPNGFEGSSAAFCQLAAPTTLWICDWTVAQYNTVPQIPDPFSVGSGWVLLDIHLEPAMQGLAPDGVSVLWRISGTYFFGNKSPGAMSNYNNSVIAQANFPRPQWLADTFPRSIPASALTTGLVNKEQDTQRRKPPEPPEPPQRRKPSGPPQQ